MVISDSHGNLPALTRVLVWAGRLPKGEAVTEAAFLGDGIKDIPHAEKAAEFACNWTPVKGNNDYDVQAPESVVMDFAGKRFFVCHGHRYSLYSGYGALHSAALQSKAEAVLFGHTHVPSCKTIDDIMFINPGSIGQPRNRTGPSFALINCSEGDEIKVQFYCLTSDGKIEEYHGS